MHSWPEKLVTPLLYAIFRNEINSPQNFSVFSETLDIFADLNGFSWYEQHVGLRMLYAAVLEQVSANFI